VWLVTMKGPAGSGKSTLARALSRHFGWPMIDKDDVKDLLDSHTSAATHQWPQDTSTSRTPSNRLGCVPGVPWSVPRSGTLLDCPSTSHCRYRPATSRMPYESHRVVRTRTENVLRNFQKSPYWLKRHVMLFVSLRLDRATCQATNSCVSS
jgi:Cytidylate kinase